MLTEDCSTQTYIYILLNNISLRESLPCHTCPYAALILQAHSFLDPSPVPSPAHARHQALGAACVCWAPSPLSANGRPQDPNLLVGADAQRPSHFCGFTLIQYKEIKGREWGFWLITQMLTFINKWHYNVSSHIVKNSRNNIIIKRMNNKCGGFSTGVSKCDKHCLPAGSINPTENRISYLLFECATNSFGFLPAHSPDHSISVGLNRNLLIISLCWLPNTYKDYCGLENQSIYYN